MSVSVNKALVCSVAAAFVLTVGTPPAHSGNSFATGAIIGGIAGGGKGAAIGLILGGAGGAGSLAIRGSKELKLESGTEMLVHVTR